MELYHCNLLEEIQDIEGLSNSFWYMYVYDRSHSPNKLQKNIIEVLFLSFSLVQEETHIINTYID